MKWQVTEEVQQEPLSLEYVKEYLRYDDGDTSQDSVLNALISAARRYAENHMERAIADQEITVKRDSFPLGRIKLPLTGATSVTEITYTDEDGNEQTVSTDVYAVDAVGVPNAVYLKADQEWPDTLSQDNAVSVVYRAGEDFTQSGVNVAENIEVAMLLLIGHWDENRSAVEINATSTPVQMAVEALLGQKRVMGV